MWHWTAAERERERERERDPPCFVNFEMPINCVEEDEEKDWELPPDLLRMVEQEEREIKSHQEGIEVVNLGTGGEKKEVKICTCVSADIQEELVALLRHY